MATIRIVLSIISLTLFGQLMQPYGNFLGNTYNRKDTFSISMPNKQEALRLTVLHVAKLQLHVREKTGSNDGIAVEQYLRYTGNKKGDPWCASFVSWVFNQAGLRLPKTAWSPALFPLTRQILKPMPADVFGIYFLKLGRIAHCGLVEKLKGNWVLTIEGNTNGAGLREGDGVYRKRRHIKTIKYFADWSRIRKEMKP